MGLRSRSLVLASAVATALLAADAAAAENAFGRESTGRRGPAYQAFDAQGIVYVQLMPKPTFGADMAYVVGNRNFNLRLGAIIVGSPAGFCGM